MKKVQYGTLDMWVNKKGKMTLRQVLFIYRDIMRSILFLLWRRLRLDSCYKIKVAYLEACIPL